MQRAPVWRGCPWILNTRAWLPQNRPRVYTVGLHASGREARVAFPDSCESVFVVGHLASMVAAQAQ
eukprot:10565595-Lingulodinium_polyedra.AAC.1